MNITWNELSKRFRAEVALPNQDILAAGHLIATVSIRWFVRINAGHEGIVIKRCPFSFLYSDLRISWTEIATVTEFSSGIRKIFESARDQSNALLVFKDAMSPDLMVPWCIEFNKFLPKAIGYIDQKDEIWSAALSKMHTMRNNR